MGGLSLFSASHGFIKKQSDKTSRAAATTLFVRDVFLEKLTFKACDHLSSATVSSY
jgi:hypothetical protein